MAGGLGAVVGLGGGLDGEPPAAGPGPGEGAEAEGPGAGRIGEEGERDGEIPAEGAERRRGGEGGGELGGGEGSRHSCGGWLMAAEEHEFPIFELVGFATH